MIQKNQKNEYVISERGELGRGISFVKNPTAKYYRDNFVSMRQFDCAIPLMNGIFYELFKHDECTHFIFYRENDDIPIGFCSLCCSSLRVEAEDDYGKFFEIMPSIEFRYFALRKDLWGTKISENFTISSYIFNRCVEYGIIIGSLIVSAKYLFVQAIQLKIAHAPVLNGGSFFISFEISPYTSFSSSAIGYGKGSA